MAPHQLVRVIKLRPGQQVQAGGIHQNPRRAALDYQIVRLSGFVELELVLKATASAGQHRDTKCCLPPFASNNFGDTGSGSIGDTKAS